MNATKETIQAANQNQFMSVKNIVTEPANNPIKANPDKSIFTPLECESGRFFLKTGNKNIANAPTPNKIRQSTRVIYPAKKTPNAAAPLNTATKMPYHMTRLCFSTYFETSTKKMEPDTCQPAD